MPLEVWSKAFVHPAEEVLEEYCFRRLPEPALSALEEHLYVCDACRAELEELGTYIRLVKAAAASHRDSLASVRSLGTRSLANCSLWPMSIGIPPIPAWPRLTGMAVAGAAVVLLATLVLSPMLTPRFSGAANEQTANPETVLLTALRGEAAAPAGSVSGASSASSGNQSDKTQNDRTQRDGVQNDSVQNDLPFPFESGLAPKVQESSPDANRREASGGRGFTHANASRTLHLVIDPHSLPGNQQYRLALVDTEGDQAWTGAMTAQGNLLSTQVSTKLSRGIYWARLYSAHGELVREFGLQLD